MLLPRDRVWFERQSWPDIVILLDDSQSMSTVDQYKDTRIKQVADRLAEHDGMTDAERLSLAQALLTDRRDAGPTDRRDWLTAMLTQRKVRVHVYHCSSRAHRLKDVTTPRRLDRPWKRSTVCRPSRRTIRASWAWPCGRCSTISAARRWPPSSCSPMASRPEGEDLVKASKYARQMGVPLFFVGIGDAQEVQDIYLHDLTAADSAYVNDRLIFTVNVTAQGYNRLSVPVTLREKGKDKILDKKTVSVRRHEQDRQGDSHCISQPNRARSST